MLDPLQRVISIKLLYFIGQAIGAFCYSIMIWNVIWNKWISWALFTVGGIFGATIFVLPYSVMGMVISKEDSGIYIGIFNMVQGLQILIHIYLYRILITSSSCWTISYSSSTDSLVNIWSVNLPTAEYFLVSDTTEENSKQNKKSQNKDSTIVEEEYVLLLISYFN